MTAPASPRVVSLVPSVTETLLAWGVTPVACTRFCEQPDLPHVGGTKDPDVAAIVELAPDLVVLCVEENRRDDADALAEAGVATAALSIDGVADVPPALRMLAALTGVEHAAAADVAAAEASVGPDPPTRLRAFVPIWKRPWMSLAGGTYGSSLLAAVGVANVFADADARYPTVTLDEVRDRRPDVVLAPSEPYPFGERHVPLFADVAPVVLVDGQDLFWWGVRTPAAVGRLRERLARVTPR
ncbi:MAG TPA: helical backbone metal receptor [Acidimicrobiales bacterium]|nr:helical backbone metal receptor [Acidimicrobiales bacterium]